MAEPTLDELVAKYENAFDDLSDEAQKVIRAKLAEALDGYLMMPPGEPKSYAGYRDLVFTVTLGMVSWMLAEGYVFVMAEHRAGAEDVATRKEREAKRKGSALGDLKRPGIVAQPLQPNSSRYL